MVDDLVGGLGPGAFYVHWLFVVQLFVAYAVPSAGFPAHTRRAQNG